MKNLVSIIIANYNKEKYIRESLEATLNQDYANIEVIIVDDGSTDSSPRIIKEIAADEPRLQYKRCDHKGKVNAYNYGISLAKGDFLKIWSSDDILLKNAISVLVQEIEGFDLVCHNSNITDEHLNIVKEDFFSFNIQKTKKATIQQVINGLSFPSGLYLFSRKVWEAIFPIPEESAYEDWYIFMNIVSKDFKIKLLNKSLSHYRQYNTSSFGGILNYDKNVFLYRLARNAKMIDVFIKNLPKKYENQLINQNKEFELVLNGDIYSIITHKCPLKIKSKIFIQRYLYFLWVIYRKWYSRIKK